MDFLVRDPANVEETREPVRTKRIAHALQTSVNSIAVFRWHGTRLESKRYRNTPRNFARYIALRDRIDETQNIPF